MKHVPEPIEVGFVLFCVRQAGAARIELGKGVVAHQQGERLHPLERTERLAGAIVLRCEGHLGAQDCQCRQAVLTVEQHIGQGAQRLINDLRHLFGTLLHRLPKQRDCLRHPPFLGLQQRGLRKCDRVLRVDLAEVPHGGLRLVAAPQHALHQGLERQQASAIGMLFFQPLNLIEAGEPLLSFDHFFELGNLGHQIGTAELELFAGAARAE